MPERKLCKANGCFRLAEVGRKYCQLHEYMEQEDRERDLARFKDFTPSLWRKFYDSPRWRAMAEKKRQETPNCEICGAPATEIHHLIPHRGDPELFFDYGNLQALCHRCHTEQTKREARERRQKRQKDRGKLWF